MKVGLLLEGGGMRGLYTAGIIDVLMEENILVDDLVGVSAGALFGMNYKSKQVGRVLRYNKKYASSRKFMGLHSLLTTGNIINKDFCFDKLVNELDPIDYKTYKNNKTKLYAVVTNMETGKAEYIEIDDLEDKDQMEYLRASGAMPFVSRPVAIGDKKFLDGGIADSIPIEKMEDQGYDKIIAVLTRPEGYRKKKSRTLIPKLYYRKYPNLVDTITNRYRVYNGQLDTIKKLEKEGKIFVLRPSRLVEVKRTEKDPEVLQEMYDLGVHDIREKFPQLVEYLKK